jgi:hypothetical protein
MKSSARIRVSACKRILGAMLLSSVAAISTEVG